MSASPSCQQWTVFTLLCIRSRHNVAATVGGAVSCACVGETRSLLHQVGWRTVTRNQARPIIDVQGRFGSAGWTTTIRDGWRFIRFTSTSTSSLAYFESVVVVSFAHCLRIQHYACLRGLATDMLTCVTLFPHVCRCGPIYRGYQAMTRQFPACSPCTHYSPVLSSQLSISCPAQTGPTNSMRSSTPVTSIRPGHRRHTITLASSSRTAASTGSCLQPNVQAAKSLVR